MSEEKRGMNWAALRALLNEDAENFITASTPGGIEAQERAGQIASVASEVLPKEANFGMPTDELYPQLGIEILGDADDLFYRVRLPDGWSKVAVDHAMWSKLVDDQGRERGSIFYKAAFYDRSAHFSVAHRFHYGKRPVGGWEAVSDLEQYAWEGYVTDCGETIYTTDPSPEWTRDESYTAPARELIDAMQEQAKSWLQERFPDFANPLAYWD